MNQAPHSTRIRLGTLENLVKPLRFPIRNLKASFKNCVLDGGIHEGRQAAVPECPVVEKEDSLLNTRPRMEYATD